MAESDMRARVVRALKPYDAVAVENPARPGTPDVNYVEGWLELKWLRAWPKKPDTPVRLEHLTPQQDLWMSRRWRAGGCVHLLFQCKNTWLLFRPDVVKDLRNGLTRDQMIDRAVAVWSKCPTGQQLYDEARRNPE